MDSTSLPPGTTIGHYVIERLVAVGGSASVYQARDPRACRTVAIKLLLDDPSVDSERGRRLLHEARAYTRLVHPRIVTLYEVGEEQGRAFLAMEWVEGVTLAERLAGGPLSEEDALRVMSQVADGLSAAHSLGLAHRDLKPANIMLTPEGDAKLLDFGLVKPVATEGGLPQSWVTVDGALLGTPAYMSPEQVRGETLRLASDVFSFGVIMYEMLGGEPAFSRASTLETLNAVAEVTYEPLPRPRSALGKALHFLMERCLNREAEARPRDARELVVELQRIESGLHPTPGRSSFSVRAAVLGAVLALVVGTGLWWAAGFTGPPPSPMQGVRELAVDGSLPVISPDGGSVVHCSPDLREIWLSPVGVGNPELVWAGAEPIESLGLTPDGRWVLFAAAGHQGPSWVWEVPIDGGLPRKVTRGCALAVAPDGQTIAAFERHGAQDHRAVVCRRDGTERRLLATFTSSMVPKACSFSDDGSELVVVLTDGLRSSKLMVIDVSDGHQREVATVRGVAGVGLAVATEQNCALWCLRTTAMSTAMVVVSSLADGVTHGLYPGPGLASFPSISADGTKIVFQVQQHLSELVEVEVDPNSGIPNSTVRVLSGTRGAGQPRLSPDGRRLTFQSARGDLWVMDRATGSIGPLLTTGEASFNPAWSPDGRMVAYSCLKNDRSALWLAGADGSDPRRITDGNSNCFQPVWHPDGRHLLFISDHGGPEELYRMDIDSGETLRLTSGGAANPAVSPDGERVAFSSGREGGTSLLQVARLDPHLSSIAVEWQRSVLINRWVGAKARFSPDGRWLAFDQPSGPVGGDVWAVPVVGGGEVDPVRLTSFPFTASLLGWFDWGVDNRLVVTATRARIRVLMFEEGDQWLERLGS